MNKKERKNIDNKILSLINEIPKNKTDGVLFLSTRLSKKNQNNIETALVGMPKTVMIMIIEGLKLNNELSTILATALYNFLDLKENKELLKSFKRDLDKL